jgi:hypothetical protein
MNGFQGVITLKLIFNNYLTLSKFIRSKWVNSIIKAGFLVVCRLSLGGVKIALSRNTSIGNKSQV